MTVTVPSLSNSPFLRPMVIFLPSDLLSGIIKNLSSLACVWASLMLSFVFCFERVLSKDGNETGHGRRMRYSPLLRIVLSCPIPVLSRVMEKFFLPHTYPLRLRKVPSYPVKLYYLLICPINFTFF